MPTLTLYPGWKQAVKDVMDAGALPDTILTNEKLAEIFGLKEPITAAEQRDFQMEFMKSICRVKETLLEEHLVDLVSVHSIGYRIVAPEAQTALAMTQGIKRVKKQMRDTGRRLVFLNRSALSSDQVRENDDAVAKLSMLQSMTARTAKRLRIT